MRLGPAVAGLALLLAGCAITAPSPTPTTSPSPTASRATAGSGTPVAIDPSLLEHVPAQVDGVDLTRRPESDAVAAADPVVIEFGEGVVTALAIDPATEDFAYVALVRLRDGTFSDELFRSWRGSFAEGACSQAGGVIRTAVTEIDGRDVYIDTCDGGLRVYHAWLPKSRVLVSVSALGERRLGELLVQDLVD